jgi:hypothetical protein
MKSEETIKQVASALELSINRAKNENKKASADILYYICWWLYWTIDQEKEFEKRMEAK